MGASRENVHTTHRASNPPRTNASGATCFFALASPTTNDRSLFFNHFDIQRNRDLVTGYAGSAVNSVVLTIDFCSG
jgi:hypothetical protein